MSALFDFTSLLVVILLFICTTTYIRSLYPTIFSNGEKDDKHDGIKGFCWKASRIGERVSLYVAIGCVLMAIHVLFFHG